MKKQILFLVATLATLFTIQTASAQGEWKWANYWSGTDGGGAYNEIVQTAFDEDGNIYVFGEIGGQPTLNGQTLQFTSHPYAFNISKLSSILAKFDTLGNMLWYKMVKSSDQVHCLPHWMEVKDNKVYISGNMSLDYVDYSATVNNVWLYFTRMACGENMDWLKMIFLRLFTLTGRATRMCSLISSTPVL